MEWFGSRRKMLTHYRREWGKVIGVRLADSNGKGMAWLDDIGLKEGQDFVTDSFKRRYYFREERYATLFKLRWGGYLTSNNE
jgi:hypothetical protein